MDILIVIIFRLVLLLASTWSSARSCFVKGRGQANCARIALRMPRPLKDRRHLGADNSGIGGACRPEPRSRVAEPQGSPGRPVACKAPHLPV